MALVKHQLSQITFGRVLSLRDDQTNEVAIRPTPGRTKTITHSEEVTVTITPSDPDAAAIYEPMTISLGLKTWAKDVPDIDPLWQEWLDAGLIKDDLLADVAEPTEDVLARAKLLNISLVDQWLATQDAAGIDVGNGIFLKSDANAATQLQVYLAGLTPGVDTILVSDVSGAPHIVQWHDLANLTATFKAEFFRRRQAWATARMMIQEAATIDELNAVEMPS